MTVTRPGAGVLNMGEEVLDLPLAPTKQALFDLPSGGHRFGDLCHLLDFQGVKYNFDFIVEPIRFKELKVPGEFSATVHVFADNADPQEVIIRWRWRGGPSDLDFL